MCVHSCDKTYKQRLSDGDAAVVGNTGPEGAPSPLVCVCTLQSVKHRGEGGVCIPLMN